MTPKQRVYAALKKKPADRVPIFMWFHPETAQKLGRLLEIPPQYVPQALGDDISQTWVNNNYAMEAIVHEQDGQSHIDEWNIKWTRTKGFNQITEFPLAHATDRQILEYQFPEHKIDQLVDRMEPLMQHKDQYFIGCDVSPNVFEMYWRLRNMENVFMEMAQKPQFAKKMLKKTSDFSIRLAEKACQKYHLDWLWLGDDVGYQQSMLMNPKTWRDMIKPLLKENVDVGKKHSLYVAFHSCGTIRPIIEDLIEIGVDVLNPIQCNCTGMDSKDLKKNFGKYLAFMGGVDTQGVLPNGTAYEVEKSTAELVENMTCDGGGFILAASHTVPPETPHENIFAMYRQAGISKQQILDNAANIRSQLKMKNLN